MKTPQSLVTAVDCGIIEEVVRPLMSGKEAQVYVVVADGRECVAKVYKEASQRTFKHRAEYTEGRRTRNSRDQRAINKRSRHGKSQDEAGWRSTEVDMICRLRDADVRVPETINFVDGVLIMEFVKDRDGDPAPRLGDLSFTRSEARTIYKQLLREVIRMLCAGVIHGDLSEFNVLMGADGPVVIDFPQSLEAARNQSARKFLLRDVDNLHRFVERYSPNEPMLSYGEEIWELYESNRLDPDTELRGDYQAPDDIADTREVLALIEDAEREEFERREARGEEAPGRPPSQLRKVVDFTNEAQPGSPRGGKPRPGAAQRPGRKPAGHATPEREKPAPRSAKPTRGRGGAEPARPQGDAKPKRRRNRRGRKTHAGAARGTDAAGETSTNVSARGPAPAPSTPRPAAAGATGAGAAEGKPGRRRRSGRARKRSASGEDKTGAAGGAQPRPKPTRAAAKPREASDPKPTSSTDGRQRPARRRRRRPRTSGSSGSSDPG